MAGTAAVAPVAQYLLDKRFQVVLTGRWKHGGTLDIFFAGEPIETIKLAGAAFALLGVLMLQAKEARTPQQACMVTDELQRAMRAVTDLDLDDRKRVHRILCDLRKKLNRGLSQNIPVEHTDGPERFGMRFVESHTLGYRLSLPPENMTFNLVNND